MEKKVLKFGDDEFLPICSLAWKDDETLTVNNKINHFDVPIEKRNRLNEGELYEVTSEEFKISRNCIYNNGVLWPLVSTMDNVIQFPNVKTAKCFDCDAEFELEDDDDILCPECSDDYL